ncbi:MAG: HAMP domain-containing histidine kinase [Ruminococcaceae bacterium]|nr:HAMP domain-containing histidine kinase [Oscillospiraceae bacterium]
MAEHRTFRTLTLKLMAVMCLALAAAILTALCMVIVGNALVEQVYLSSEAVNKRMGAEITAFRSFVEENQLASTNVNAVGQWNREHPNINLTIYGRTTTMTSTPDGAELVGNEAGIVVRSDLSLQMGMEYPVNFRDGVFTVAIYDNSRGMVSAAVNLSALGLAALVFLATVLLYDQHLTRTVQTLSRQVRQVSRGDLEMQIKPQTSDEIGQLALDVDAMRLSIIDKLQREEQAWQANSQLITAISHDVRTPLTALMGYLEIVSDESLSPEERQIYLEVCKNNAHRLKSLTDELFGFFLVFGKPTPDQVLEEFDAVTILDQVLLEHVMDLTQRGFQVETSVGEVSGKLMVDLGHFRRIFDNLFSNVRKYADPSCPVTISQRTDRDELIVTISNHINRSQTRVESNRIGLQTCHKLVAAMGGEFSQHRTKETFMVEVVLPLHGAVDG